MLFATIAAMSAAAVDTLRYDMLRAMLDYAAALL